MKRYLCVMAALAVAAMPGSVEALAGASGAPATATAFIRRDSGTNHVNKNVSRHSSCESPDRFDTQSFERFNGRDTSVHVDGCLRDGRGRPVDGTVTFESVDIGTFSCPDPDGTGAKRAFAHDHDDDHVNDDCHLTGSTTRGAHGRGIYHLRANNDGAPGQRQTIIFCFDPQQSADDFASEQPAGHGCSDTKIKSKVVIAWGDA
ncbi:MAG: hypothetical protein M3134_08050 [Actinomycetota bacterium]|nr:hypothetical protein [Actinomycetota bacterium]